MKYYTRKKDVPKRKGYVVDFKKTKGYYLRRIKPVVVIPKPPHIDLSPVQRCLFLTDDIGRALDAQGRLLIATADLGYRHNYTDAFLHSAIKRNILRVWCDCRIIDGTSPQVALAWLYQLGLPRSYFYGQCENATEFNTGYNAGARKMVGIMSGLTSEQIKKVDSGEVLISNETYYNKDRNYGVDWKNADGVGSNCMAVYASSSEGATYYSLRQQAIDGKYLPNRDCVYAAGLKDDDWNMIVYN